MAARAILRRTGERAVDVAGLTTLLDVLAGEREVGEVVVKLGALPSRRGVADLAGRRETGSGMVRIIRAVVVLQVARRAILRRPGKLPVDVALLAVRRDMLAGQREVGRRVVIERRVAPIRRVVTRLTSGRETGGSVVRIVRAVVVLQVARRAVVRRPGKLPIHMALLAVRRDMFAGQRKVRRRVVVERRVVPVRGVVARLAGGRETGGGMIGVIRSVVVLQMATRTVLWRASELSVHVTLPAVRRYVLAGQRKPRKVMIELGSRPLLCRMAVLTLRGEISSGVVWVLGRAEVWLVA